MAASNWFSGTWIGLCFSFALVLLSPVAEAYTISPGTWSPADSMTRARGWGFTATRLRSGDILVVGGFTSNDLVTSSAELYNPFSGLFSVTDSMSFARGHHTAVLLRDGKVLIDGGAEVNTPSEIYDPSGTFNDTGVPSIQRAFGASALLPDGKVITLGLGMNQTGNQSVGEVYDPAAGTYSNVATNQSLCPRRENLTATTLNDGTVLLAGGDDGNGAFYNCAEIYDPSVRTIFPISPMTSARAGHTATLLTDGRVLIAGGENNTGLQLASAEVYDPRTRTFTSTGSMTVARTNHSATLLPNGQVLIATGSNGSQGGLSSAELYSPSSGTFTSTGSLPGPRTYDQATLLPNAMTLIEGGFDNSANYLASALVYAPPNAVNIGAPQPAEIVFGSNVTIQTEYAHPNPVQWIDVYIDGSFLGASPPQSFTWDASKMVNGPHVISAKAFNSNGSVVGTSAVTVNVANGPVALFWPKEKATVSHKVAIAVTKGPGVQWIDFYLDGKFMEATPPNTIYWDSSTVANGSHILSANGFNGSGQTVGTDSVVVNVLN